MSEMDLARELAGLLVGPPAIEPPRLLQGVVSSVQVGAVTVYLSGGSTLPVGNIRHLNSYQPAIGDVVWILKNGPDLIVIGELTPRTVTEEPWRVVGATGQPAFAGGWVNYDATGPNSHADAAFYKESSGVVRFKGLVRSGAGVMFTLPVGYRPINSVYSPCASNSAHGLLQVDANGNVSLNSGSNAWVSLSSLRFVAQDTIFHREDLMCPGSFLGAWTWTQTGRGIPSIFPREDGLCLLRGGDLSGGAATSAIYLLPDVARSVYQNLFAGWGFTGAAVFNRIDVAGYRSNIFQEVSGGSNDLRLSGLQWFGKGMDYSKWTTLVLQNAWVDYAGGLMFHPPMYYKDKYGLVHVRGVIKNGATAAGTILATLPPGYRPLEYQVFMSVANNTFVRFDIESTGNITLQSIPSSNAYLSLDNLCFRAEQ